MSQPAVATTTAAKSMSPAAATSLWFFMGSLAGIAIAIIIVIILIFVGILEWTTGSSESSSSSEESSSTVISAAFNQTAKALRKTNLNLKKKKESQKQKVAFQVPKTDAEELTNTNPHQNINQSIEQILPKLKGSSGKKMKAASISGISSKKFENMDKLKEKLPDINDSYPTPSFENNEKVQELTPFIASSKKRKASFKK